MISLSLSRADYVAATDLIDRFGLSARDEAVARANDSRDRGNIVRFCSWRQAERMIVVLAASDVTGTVH
jgi:hypothetical protein